MEIKEATRNLAAPSEEENVSPGPKVGLKRASYDAEEENSDKKEMKR